MKKALRILIVLFFSATATQAQIGKGSILLGGNLGFGNSKNANNGYYKLNYVSLSPAIGVAVKTNLVAGITFTYYNGKYSPDSSTTTPQNTTNTGGSFFLRRYFLVAKNFYLYGQGELGYNHTRYKVTDNGYSQITVNNVISLDVAPGMAYAVSKKFHVELGLNNLLSVQYAKTKNEISGVGGVRQQNGHAFNMNTSLSTAAPLYIGFRVLLGK